jgi:ABC-type sugar transport system substrate-binding protein
MRKRKLQWIASALLILFACGACNGKKPGSGVSTGGASGAIERQIVFVFKVDGLLYGDACKRGAEQASEELDGVTVRYLAPDKADVGKQIEIIEQLIAEKVDAIVISPNDAEAIRPIVDRATESGVKVFTWDSDAPNSKRLFYVGADDVGIGVEVADRLAKDMGGTGKVQIVSGGRAADNLNAHVDGFVEGFKKYPGITLVEPYIYNDDDNQKARSLAVQAFQKDPDITGFACANSPSPPAVGQAVTQLNKIGKVKVWGLALPSETKQYLESAAVSGLILWDPAKLTYMTARLVNDYLDGKAPTDGMEFPEVGKLAFRNNQVVMPTAVITKENVDQFNF